MSNNSTSKSGTQIVRALLLLVGAMMVAYAISDHPFYGGEPGFGRLQVLVTVVGVGLAICVLLPAQISGRILLLTVTGLVMLAVAEIAGEIVLGPRYRPIYQFDDRLIFKFIPSRRSVMTRNPRKGGETVAHRINSAGFRGDELLLAGEMTRVVVYGDSFIHAFYSPQEETFVAQLGRLLADRIDKQVEVVNAGVSSYGPDQIVLKMEDELPKLRPELVIVAIFAGNDYGDLMRNKIFRLAADGALVANRWKLDRNVRVLLELNRQESITLRALRNTLGALRAPPDPQAGAANMDFLLEEAAREYQNFVVERDDIVTNTHVDHYSADVSLTPRSASARYKVALMQAVMRRIGEVAERNDVPFAFLFIPHPLDVADGDAWGRVDRKRFPDYNGRNQIAFLEEMARVLGAPYVSLYDVFRANNANSLYFRDGDDHWNAAGQRLAAEVMADYLLAHGLPHARGTAMRAPAHPKVMR